MAVVVPQLLTHQPVTGPFVLTSLHVCISFHDAAIRPHGAYKEGCTLTKGQTAVGLMHCVDSLLLRYLIVDGALEVIMLVTGQQENLTVCKTMKDL